MSNLELGVIGNCTFGALIDPRGRIVWSCLPLFDGDPVFSSLLNGDDPEAGFYEIELIGMVRHEQAYLRNTAILRTLLEDDHGNALEIIDFAPRFRHYERDFRPSMIVRQLRPLRGSPRIRVRLRPTFEYNTLKPQITRGSNHCRFVSPTLAIRLTTNLPISFVLQETAFLLDKPAALLLGPDESLPDSIEGTARGMFEQTLTFWQEWTRGLSIPFEWQEAVIRAAITLKLCNFEESGAILAALTTSIPEFANSGRNWDYRLCWLRDAYFVVHALNRLGATRTMEHHLSYISNLVAAAEDGDLQPVYGLSLQTALEEREAASLAGYRGMGPVRVGNQAYIQPQNDVYGSAVLACTQAFFDERLSHPGDASLFERLERLGRKAIFLYDKPDSGLWELRNTREVHTFSAVMCWAACDRLAKIAAHLGRGDRARHWREHADRIHAVVSAQAWNEELGSFAATFGGKEMDASLLLLHELGFISAEDPRFRGTVLQVERQLRHGNHMFRYITPDDFGRPEVAFTVCTFWYIDALAAIGRREEARALFESLLKSRNKLGLLSEDIDPETGELWGNYPQAYSLVGLINSATRLSRSWQESF